MISTQENETQRKPRLSPKKPTQEKELTGQQKMQEKIKDPHFKQRLLNFLEEKAALFDDIFEAQALRNTKSSQMETLAVAEEVLTSSSEASINNDNIYFSERLNALLIVRVDSA